MNNFIKPWLPLLVSMVFLAGCATTRPVAYQALASRPELAPNPQDNSGHTPFMYSAPHINWSKYHSVILDPVTIYLGSDQQFGKLSGADKARLANDAQTRFAAELETKYTLVSSPGPDTLRVHLTLTGAQTTTQVLSTLQQLLPIGAVINLGLTADDKQSGLMGSVSYAAEIYDSASHQLLRAYVSKQYAAAENIPASIGTLSAAKTGLSKGAKLLLTQLQ